MFDDLTETFDDKVKKYCIATRLRGSVLQYFESIREKEAKDIETLIESFKTRFIERNESFREAKN